MYTKWNETKRHFICNTILCSQSMKKKIRYVKNKKCYFEWIENFVWAVPFDRHKNILPHVWTSEKKTLTHVYMYNKARISQRKNRKKREKNGKFRWNDEYKHYKIPSADQIWADIILLFIFVGSLFYLLFSVVFLFVNAIFYWKSVESLFWTASTTSYSTHSFHCIMHCNRTKRLQCEHKGKSSNVIELN